MPEQDMIHCFEHCMTNEINWSCTLPMKKHKLIHFVGCYWGTINRHELTPEEIEELPEYESDIPKESIFSRIKKKFLKYVCL